MYDVNKLLFSNEHEWVFIENDNAVIGISNHAQNSLGDVVFVELPKIGTKLTKNSVIGSIESIKAVSTIYSPISGEVIEINKNLENNPELVNNEPYGKGWLFKIKFNPAEPLDSLMDHSNYQTFLKT